MGIGAVIAARGIIVVCGTDGWVCEGCSELGLGELCVVAVVVVGGGKGVCVCVCGGGGGRRWTSRFARSHAPPAQAVEMAVVGIAKLPEVLYLLYGLRALVIMVRAPPGLCHAAHAWVCAWCMPSLCLCCMDVVCMPCSCVVGSRLPSGRQGSAGSVCRQVGWGGG